MAADDHDPSLIREAVAVFVDADEIRAAMNELISVGFERAELGLLAGEYTVKQTLGDLYTRTNELAESSDAPNTAFVADESVGDTAHAGLGSLYYTGTTVAAGAAVASASILGGALVAAIAGAAAIGAIGAVLGLVIHQSDAEHFEQQIEEGHLLLFVRTRDSAHEDRAREILSKHTPIEVKIVDVTARRAEQT